MDLGGLQRGLIDVDDEHCSHEIGHLFAASLVLLKLLVPGKFFCLVKCKVLQSGEQKSVEQYVVPILHVFCVIHSVSQYILREDIKRRFYSSSSIDVFLKPFPSEVYETLKYCAKPNKTSYSRRNNYNISFPLTCTAARCGFSRIEETKLVFTESQNKTNCGLENLTNTCCFFACKKNIFFSMKLLQILSIQNT